MIRSCATATSCINTDPLTTRANLGPIRKALLDDNISSHLAGVDTSADLFFMSGAESVTFTVIHRAKGNEAGMVYIVNAQECQSSTYNLARVRNRPCDDAQQSLGAGVGCGPENGAARRGSTTASNKPTTGCRFGIPPHPSWKSCAKRGDEPGRIQRHQLTPSPGGTGVDTVRRAHPRDHWAVRSAVSGGRAHGRCARA